MSSEPNDYNAAFQKLFLEMMLHEPELYARVQNIYNPQNFDKSLKATADFMYEYANDYSSLPSLQVLEGATGSQLQPVTNYDDASGDWFLTEFEKFTRKQELSRAILAAADMLEEGDYDPVEKLIKDAVQIS